jgi:4-hydroxythreonine-4-phosphate dehydrogenase
MKSKPLAITMGDPAGIGPEIVLKSFLSARIGRSDSAIDCPCVVLGDVPHLERAKLSLGQDGEQLELLEIRDLESVYNIGGADLPNSRIIVPVLQVCSLGQSEHNLSPVGQVSAMAGQIAYQNIVWGARAALSRRVRALVTAPIHKQSLSLAQVDFPGHTEILQYEAAKHSGLTLEQLPVKMMLQNEELRVVLVSIHISLKEAISLVTQEEIIRTLDITHLSLKKLLGRSARIAVAGLNPHSGEGGLMGREELDVISPAIARARELDSSMDITGPISPDTVFMRARGGVFDVVIAMYHDQGLIPIKYMGLENGVNVTLGLPMVRTSPDHGTAFDVAGQGVADPSSMMYSIQVALNLTK